MLHGSDGTNTHGSKSPVRIATMTDLCQLWGVDKTRTTPYHPHAKWHGRKKQERFGRLSPSHVVGERSRRVGRVVTTGIKGVPRDPSYCHWRNSHDVDVGEKAEAA